MADPVLDEEEILEDLHRPVSHENLSRLQMAAVAAMCDLYDRKVTREEFIKMLGPCLSMYGAAIKLFVIGSVRTSYHRGDVTEDNLNMTVGVAEDLVRSHCGNVRSIMKQLMECPTSQDKVH